MSPLRDSTREEQEAGAPAVGGKRHGPIRARWIVLALLVVLVLGARAAIDPLAEHFTQRGLDAMENFEGRFDDVSLSVFALSYTIEGLEIREREGTTLPEEPLDEGSAPATRTPVEGGGPRPQDVGVPRNGPLFASSRVRARILWRNLLHGEILGTARVERPHATVRLKPGRDAKERAAEEALDEPPKPWQLDETVRSLIPFKVERVEVLDGEVVLVDQGQPGHPRIRFSALEATVENFTTRRAVGDAQPLTLALRCDLQESGKVTVVLTADLLAEDATFTCQAQLLGLRLDDIREYVVAATDGLALPQGVLDCFASFECVQGQLSGGIKPLLKDAEAEAVTDDFIDQLREGLLDVGIDLFSDRVPGREAVVTIIPVEGNIDRPGIATWSTIVTLLRNAFVEGLAASFRGLVGARGDTGAAAVEGDGS